jgi:chorismate mutase
MARHWPDVPALDAQRKPVADASQDPVVQQLREQISDNDLVILDALNKRLSLVQRLHEYKRTRGYDVFDPGREDWMLTYITRCNRGPLSAAAVRDLWPMLVKMTTREAARINDEASTAAGS